jgi:Uma2 family endonuclease
MEQYLQFERAQERKHEYYAGEIVALAGTSERHNVILTNLIAGLHGQLRKRPCNLYPSDMRVKIPRSRTYTYPDISVVCGSPTYDDPKRDTLVNPMVIIEILSPSTEAYDRGKKFASYRMIESLQEYIMVSQEKLLIEQYVRQSDHQWALIVHMYRDTTVQLQAIQCQLAVADIYENVDFDPDESASFDQSDG